MFPKKDGTGSHAAKCCSALVRPIDVARVRAVDQDHVAAGCGHRKCGPDLEDEHTLRVTPAVERQWSGRDRHRRSRFVDAGAEHA